LQVRWRVEIDVWLAREAQLEPVIGSASVRIGAGRETTSPAWRGLDFRFTGSSVG
jgi:hypothetical protein